MRASNTSTPTSPIPQNELQNSTDRLARPGEFSRAYFDKEVVEGCRFTVISGVELEDKSRRPKCSEARYYPGSVEVRRPQAKKLLRKFYATAKSLVSSNIDLSLHPLQVY